MKATNKCVSDTKVRPNRVNSLLLIVSIRYNDDRKVVKNDITPRSKKPFVAVLITAHTQKNTDAERVILLNFLIATTSAVSFSKIIVS